MKYILWIALWLGWNLCNLYGQQLVYKSLTIEDGLSQGMIFDILQTKDGFLWIATKDGLNRYDGYNFKIWSHTDNMWSLASNSISTLFEDSREWLWIGTENHGIQLFDRKTDRFYFFDIPIIYNKGNQVSYDVRQIAEDQEGNIWVVTRGGGVFRLQIPPLWLDSLPETHDLSKIVKLSPVSFPVPEKAVPGWIEEFRCILMAKDGNAIIGTSRNLYRVETRSLSVSKIIRPDGVPPECWQLHETLSGEIWGTTDTGIFIYNGVQFKFIPLKVIGKASSTYPAISVNNKNQIWLLFENRLWKIPENGNFDPSVPDHIMDRHGNVLFEDNLENIWIGTLGYGLRKIALRQTLFHSELEGVSIWSLWKNADGKIYCKLFNTIVEFDQKSGKLSNTSAFPDAPPQQNSIVFSKNGDQWVLCGQREGNVNFSELRHYSSKKELIKSYPIEIGRYPYASLLQSRDGCIWATGLYGKLLRLDPLTGKQKIFDFGAQFGDKIQTLVSFALQEDGKGQIWIGTQYGLVKGTVKGEAMTFKVFKPDENKPHSINHNYILSILSDPALPEKRLWIGTKGGGINCLDLDSEKFTYLNNDQGLPNNVVYGILSDEEGNLWCSSNRGLAKITILKSGEYGITPFTAGDGLQSNEFNTQAFFKAADGELLFGGVNGINHFYPKDLKFKSTSPEVYIIGLKVNYLPLKVSNSDKQAKIPIEYQKKLELDYTRNNLSFEFAAMDFTDPNKNQYRYQLLPIEKNWIRASNERFAHYTHLAPGTYTFRVQGSNSVGVWNENPVEMKIIISPPWWFSTPAYFLYSIVIGFLIWQFWRFQLNRIKLKEQLAFELREAERLKELEQLKTNFFNNVTHEFRTPLSLILEPARQILSKTEDAEIRKNATHVESNSLRLLNMINQLMDLAKLESKSIRLELRHGNLTELLQNIIHSFSPLADKLGLSLHLTFKNDIPFFFFDAGKTELIINNLISNALKFTPKGGKVEVLVEYPPLKTDEPHSSDNALLCIKVQDTGIGIASEELDKIFKRFYQVQDSSHTKSNGEKQQPTSSASTANDLKKTTHNPGTGIGLALSKEFAELMGGGISVESTVLKGSCFNFYLPMRAIDKASDQTFRKDPEIFKPPIEIHTEQNLTPTESTELPLALVIEDNQELRQFISQSIQKNWKVEEAEDGAKGIEKAIELIPDIIISDLMMPLKDGFEVCNTLKAHELTSHIPVILLTARANIESKLAGLRTGADDYLTKPFHTEELLLRMFNLLEMRRKLQARFNAGNIAISEIDSKSDSLELTIPDNEFLRRFIDIIQENIEDEDFGVEELALKMFISRSQLHRKLKAITNQNATDFIRDYRLERAMEMLQEKEVQVNEVASRIGYGNVKYFSTIFKAKYGISPSQVNSKS